MGFIEELRRKNNEQELLKTLERKRKERENKEREESLRRSSADSEAIRVGRLAESNSYYISSNFPQMTRDLARLGGFLFTEMGTPNDRYYNKDKDYVEIELSKNEFVGIPGKNDTMKNSRIEVKFTHDGRIEVIGDSRGSSTLDLSQWKNNPDAQEKALEKAYKYPKTHLWEDRGTDYGKGLSSIS